MDRQTSRKADGWMDGERLVVGIVGVVVVVIAVEFYPFPLSIGQLNSKLLAAVILSFSQILTAANTCHGHNVLTSTIYRFIRPSLSVLLTKPCKLRTGS